MPNSLVDLRLASALVHAVPGSFLTVRDGAGGSFTISRHPSANCCPAAWRCAVGRSAQPGQPAPPPSLAIEMIGGRLAAGTGAFLDVTDPGARWFATTLPACVVATVIEHDPGDVEAEIRLRPDPVLGVTVVCVECDDPAIDEVVVDLRARLAVAELATSLCGGC